VVDVSWRRKKIHWFFPSLECMWEMDCLGVLIL